MVHNIAVFRVPNADFLARKTVNFDGSTELLFDNVDGPMVILVEVVHRTIDPQPFARTMTRVVQADPSIAVRVLARRCKV